jgi:homogentisate 1,2-dioxygenase
MAPLQYQTGFGNDFSSEAILGALPKLQNSPQKPPLGLYPEQLSGSPFTAPRTRSLRTWLYKTKPSVAQGRFTETLHPTWTAHQSTSKMDHRPDALRWAAHPMPSQKIDFWDSLFTYCLNGSAAQRTGGAIHLYACNLSMQNRYATNADAEMMIVPQQGELKIFTECGILTVAPKSIAVIPRGMKFRVELLSSEARGYVCENFGATYQLPDLGPIGANGLAAPRDFESPVAAYEDLSGDFELVSRYLGRTWTAPIAHSPLNAVAWHGNYVPYRYDLTRFNTIGTVSFDHPDPSIFTVLTSPTHTPGTANFDFVIFPERWMVAENTFRPPYYHRNTMSEFMGLIEGNYDAKEGGFLPAGASVHNCMTGHGPDATAFQMATAKGLVPEKQTNTLAFI